MEKIWKVTYDAVYWVKAIDEETAIELAIEEHENIPMGDWTAEIDPWEN